MESNWLSSALCPGALCGFLHEILQLLTAPTDLRFQTFEDEEKLRLVLPEAVGSVNASRTSRS